MGYGKDEVRCEAITVGVRAYVSRMNTAQHWRTMRRHFCASDLSRVTTSEFHGDLSQQVALELWSACPPVLARFVDGDCLRVLGGFPPLRPVDFGGCAEKLASG